MDSEVIVTILGMVLIVGVAWIIVRALGFGGKDDPWDGKMSS